MKLFRVLAIMAVVAAFFLLVDAIFYGTIFVIVRHFILKYW